MTCDRNSMLTRATTTCKPWENVSFDYCIKECAGEKSANQSQKCPPKECAYVVYDAKERTCHFADKTCILGKTEDAVVVYKRDGLQG